MFGLAFNPVVIAVVAGGLLVSHGAVAYKFYSYGADRQKVVCEQRVSAIQVKINAANAKIEKQAKEHAAALEAIEAEREAETAAADTAEREASERVRSYATELSLRTDKCLPTDADLERVR